MTFLQPELLWFLPLVLLPVIIHLINRLRHRPQPWGAMMFLLRANRASTSHAKLRQWLILLFRCLAVLALILFVSRPLAGGWIGWAISPAPDVIVLLLDRSASMETRLPGATTTKREQALQLITDAAEGFQGRSQFVLIDNASRAPQSIASPAALAEPSLTGPTDAAADLPAMLQAAHTWLVENKAGTAEIWIASDLQQSNWHPGDDRWQAAIAALEALPQRARIRLLALNQPAAGDAAVSLHESGLQRRGAVHELQLALDVRHSGDNATTLPLTLPLTLALNGAGTTHDLSLEGRSVRWRHRVVLGERAPAADANLRDNAAWFVFAPQDGVRAAVVATDADATRAIRLAAGALAGGGEAELIAPPDFTTANLAGHALLVWHGPLPAGESAARIRAFAEDGGAVLFLPDGQGSDSEFAGVRWGDAQTATGENVFAVATWDRQEGPLADTEEGFTLPVDQLVARRRCALSGEVTVTAAFADGQPLLARRTLGRGAVYFCTTLPTPEWSNLGDGLVLVPMMHRLVQAGARRLDQERLLVCGELSAADRNRQWTSLDAPGKDIRFDAGIYQSGERIVAVNRSPVEDEPGELGSDAAQGLFGGLPVQLFEQRGAVSEALQGEIWRLLLFGMLLFLLVESFLILPEKSAKPRLPATGPTPARALGEPT
jgi:hypothetical protein